jgi:6-phosphofructokinase 1
VDRSEEAVANLTGMGAEALIAIGGDGSLTIAYELSQKGVPVVGVPKTIDNDLGATDVTFGFDTAITTATEAIDKLHTTAESHHRVMILEVMGRYAGWIALHSGIAGGGDVILIPEIPYDMDKVCGAILERKKQGKKSSIVVVAEGAKPKGGEMVVAKVVKDSPDPLRLGGIGNKVGEEIEQRTGIETRTTVLGHVQRGGSPTPYDRILGTRFGVEAVRQVVARNFGTMVALRGADIVAVPILEAVGKLRRVDPDGALVRIAREVGTSFGD